MIAGIKELKSAQVGDTITLVDRPASEALPGFKKVQPQVFAGLYPVESHDYEALRDALTKLQLNDAALQFEPEVSQALGFGFRCGFLGLLHMDIVQERLEREYDMDLITTAPTVVYEVVLRDGTTDQRREPVQAAGSVEDRGDPRAHHHRDDLRCRRNMSAPSSRCATQKRGMQIDMQYHGRQVMLRYDMPMNEVVMDFFDKLKSISRGYASLDYEFKEFRAGDLVKLDMLVNSEKVDALSLIVHRANSQYRGRELACQDARADSAPDVRCGDAGGHRRQHHRARERQGVAQERAGQVLRRRHHAQEETAGKTEGRQEAHETGRQRGNSAGSLPCHPAGSR